MDRLLWASTPAALSCVGKRGKDDGQYHDYSLGIGPLAGQLGNWLCRAVLQPPAPRVCGTPGGPPVTAPRVRLSDGRHLAYEESGVPREQARYRVVFSHGFTGSRLDSLRASPVSPVFFFFCRSSICSLIRVRGSAAMDSAFRFGNGIEEGEEGMWCK
jgi:hypothetical protein